MTHRYQSMLMSSPDQTPQREVFHSIGFLTLLYIRYSQDGLLELPAPPTGRIAKMAQVYRVHCATFGTR